MVNLSRLIGPAIAGFILEKFGDVFCFGLNAISFIAVISSVLMMTLATKADTTSCKKYCAGYERRMELPQHEKQLRFIISMLGFIALFVLPYSTLIPVYAKDIFKGTASTFGIIDSMIGLGAFGGAMFLASLKPGSNLEKNTCDKYNDFWNRVGFIFTHALLSFGTCMCNAYRFWNDVADNYHQYIGTNNS